MNSEHVSGHGAVAGQVDCHVRPLVERLRSPASSPNWSTADRWMIEAADEIERLRAAMQQTIDENLDLADGDVCTLILLKRALGA